MSNEVFDISTNSLIALNIVIAIMMLGVSLELNWQDFKKILIEPKAYFVGLGLQFIAFPMLTCLAIFVFQIEVGLAMGMLLIASCPGGNLSNVLVWMSKGNTALSVSMTATASLLASVMMPINFSFYTWLNPITRPFISNISLDTIEIIMFVFLVLVVPLILGMFIGHRMPALAQKINKPLKLFALMFLVVIIAMAINRHIEPFLKYINVFFMLVFLHNLMALSIGYFGAKLFGLDARHQRTMALEVGIQNGALGIVVILTFFPTATEMLLVTAFWGVWHLISGLVCAGYFARKPI